MKKQIVNNVTLENTVFYEIVEHYQDYCEGTVHDLSLLLMQVYWAKYDMEAMPNGETAYYAMTLDGLQVYGSYEHLREDLPNYCIDDPFAAYEVNLHNGIYTVSYLCGL